MTLEKIHQDVYDLLMKYHKTDQNFLFTFRQVNRKARLEKGYWFLGDDHYLAVSFWRGKDWMTRMPNISFVIRVTGQTSLDLNAKDVGNKLQFFTNELLNELDMDTTPFLVHYRKNYIGYKKNEYLKSLQDFIDGDKKVIDSAVDNNTAFYASTLKYTDPIERIYFGDFKKQLDLVNKFQLIRKKREKKTGYLKEFSVKNFTPIIDLSIKQIASGCRWIFLTGENGAGKTSVLRALAAGLTNNNDHGQPVAEKYGDFQIQIGLETLTSEISQTLVSGGIQHIDQQWLPKGFAAYGPMRLLTQGSLNDEFVKLEESRISRLATYGLFNPIGILKDISREYVLNVRPKYYKETLSDLLESIELNLPEILPNIFKVEIEPLNGGHQILYFQGTEKEGIDSEGTPFQHLPSGTRNLAGFILDLLLRFGEQQPDVRDIADYVGIVLIDEIDLHLHPKMQREIVVQLSETFPNLQFIVTTHSPIPMLGAPKNSEFIRVYKDENYVVCAEKLKIDITKYLPNAILSSPIFGFDDLINEFRHPSEKLNTEDDYNEAVFYNILARKIREQSLKKPE